MVLRSVEDIVKSISGRGESMCKGSVQGRRMESMRNREGCHVWNGEWRWSCLGRWAGPGQVEPGGALLKVKWEVLGVFPA